MLDWWCRNGQNFTGCAREFSCSKTTVFKIAKQDQWEDRFNEIIEQVRQKSDQKIVRGIAGNLKRAQTICDNIGQKLEDQGAAIEGDIHSFVRLATYIDGATGDQQPEQGREQVINVVTTIINGTEASRKHLAGNFLAGLGIYDERTVERLSKIFPGTIPSQN